ncbi:MAG TPA: cyclic nucleotide-binding domain-containing protein [Gemmatimonadaceae bacterium]
MNTPSVVARLAAMPTLDAVPREQLEWLLERGKILRFADGARFYRQYQELSGLFVVLSGRFSVRVYHEGVEREVREVTPGGISGHLPYSRRTIPRGYVVADGPVEFLLIQTDDIREMTRECYDFTAVCVHANARPRPRVQGGRQAAGEEMASLGRLSAGPAHELNNPTAAITRATAELDATREVAFPSVAAPSSLDAAPWRVRRARSYRAISPIPSR